MSQPQPQQPVSNIFEDNVVFLESQDMSEDGTFTFETEMPIMVLAQGTYCGYCRKMKPAYGEAAALLKGKVVFATIHADSENPSERDLGMRLSKLHEIPGYPAVFLVKDGRVAKKYEGNRTTQNLVEFALQ
jgi:protein disulfide isomerase family A protein 5